MITAQRLSATNVTEFDICAQCVANLSVNRQMRFMEQYTRVKSMIDSEVYGGFAGKAIEPMVAAYASAEDMNRMVRMNRELNRKRTFPWA